jgi:caspase domain-containing protein
MNVRAWSILLFLTVPFSVAAQVPDVATPSPGTSPPARVGLALVIGNSKYAQGELPTVATDRVTMAKTLESLGFKVREVADLQRPRDFQEELQTFLRAENAAPEDTLLVYYSGHGLQIDGKVYLLGTGIKGTGDMSAALREYSIDLDDVVGMMEQAAPVARVLIVDACRNNAFAVTPRKAGTAFQRGVEDTYILFADEPGKTVPARSETSLQSPFTAGLLFAFENSDEGIEKRFEVARAKTRELNSDQNPQLLKSDSSAERNRPFLDHGGRSAPTRSAGQMLNEAEELYRVASWNDFHTKIREARILSSEPDLNVRLDNELAFSELVIAARSAEADPNGPRWAEAATSWQKAAAVFVTRVWPLEKAAIAWLLGDRLQEAVGMLARLQANTGDPVADRAARLLASLIESDPSLEATAQSVTLSGTRPLGPEFEKYIVRP